MTSDSAAAPQPSPPPLELMGALCSLLIHDFANHVSVIAGNSQCAQMFGNDTQRTASALASILNASDAMANLLVKCGELRRRLGSGLVHGDLSQLLQEISTAGISHTGWTVDAPSPLEGQAVIPLHWIVFAIRELVLETKANSGRIVILKKSPAASLTGPPGLATALNAGDFLEIKLTWRSSQPFPLDEVRSKHSNLNLLAACELVKVMGGRTVCATLSPEEQGITVSLPTA
jgi:hypothetical protein